MDAVIRRIGPNELQGLLQLYAYLHPEDPILIPNDRLHSLWKEICAREDHQVIVAEVEGRLAASCVLTLIPNLTRNARPYGVVENVVTHPDFRRRGLATGVLQYAVDEATRRNAYKVMLMTGSKEEGTLLFYEKAGFRRDLKTAFMVKID